MKLGYKDHSLIKKAKGVLNTDEELTIVFYGKHALAIKKHIQFIENIEESLYAKKPNSDADMIFFKEWFYLICRFGKFMVIFWLSMANGRQMFISQNDNERVEISFSKYPKQDL